MTRKRNLRRSTVPSSAAQHPQMEMMQKRLSAPQTGNSGIIHPDGSHDIREAGPGDIHQDFGFQTQPNRIIDLPPGDAGAGKSIYRRTHIFARLDDTTTNIVCGNPMDKAIGMATYRSSDNRPRFWHISFFGIGIQRIATPVAVQPLTSNEILSSQFLPTSDGAVATSPEFIPAITQLQGRVMVFDESGQRFFDVDIMGNRSINVYAWGVTAFILGPANVGSATDQSMYEVNHGSGGNLPQTALGPGLVEDSLIGIRIVPIAVNSTQNAENRTITVLSGIVTETRIPIPPGSRKVQLICHTTAVVAAAQDIFFDAGDDGTFAGNSIMGRINMITGESKTDIILIPTCAQITILGTGLTTPVAWSIIFTVESQ